MLKGLLSDVTSLRKVSRQATLILEAAEGLSVYLARQERDGAFLLTPSDGKAARELCQRTRGRATRPPVVVCIPRRLLTMRYVSFPSTNPAEIEQMAKFETPELMPYSQRDIVHDYVRLGVTEAGYSELLLVGISRQKLEDFLKPLTEWGIEPDRVVPSSFALQAALSVARPEDRGAIVLTEVEETGVETIAMQNGRMVFSREARVSKGMERAEELRLSQMLCESVHMALDPLHGVTAPEAWVDADPATAEPLLGALRRESGVPPELMNRQRLVERVRISAMPTPPTEGSAENQPPVAAHRASLHLLGLALMALEDEEKHPQINLLPEETREKQKASARKRQTVRLAILGALCIALLLAASHAALARKERRIAALEAEISRISPEARQVEKKRMEIKLIKDQLGGSFLPFDLVMELYKLTPDGVTLSQVSIDATKGITIQGQARALSQAFDYLAVLEHSKAFSQAQARYAEKRPVGDKEIVDFEMFLMARERKR